MIDRELIKKELITLLTLLIKRKVILHGWAQGVYDKKGLDITDYKIGAGKERLKWYTHEPKNQ